MNAEPSLPSALGRSLKKRPKEGVGEEGARPQTDGMPQDHPSTHAQGGSVREKAPLADRQVDSDARPQMHRSAAGDGPVAAPPPAAEDGRKPGAHLVNAGQPIAPHSQSVAAHIGASGAHADAAGATDVRQSDHPPAPSPPPANPNLKPKKKLSRILQEIANCGDYKNGKPSSAARRHSRVNYAKAGSGSSENDSDRIPVRRKANRIVMSDESRSPACDYRGHPPPPPPAAPPASPAPIQMSPSADLPLVQVQTPHVPPAQQPQDDDETTGPPIKKLLRKFQPEKDRDEARALKKQLQLQEEQQQHKQEGGKGGGEVKGRVRVSHSGRDDGRDIKMRRPRKPKRPLVAPKAAPPSCSQEDQDEVPSGPRQRKRNATAAKPKAKAAAKKKQVSESSSDVLDTDESLQSSQPSAIDPSEQPEPSVRTGRGRAGAKDDRQRADRGQPSAVVRRGASRAAGGRAKAKAAGGGKAAAAGAGSGGVSKGRVGEEWTGAEMDKLERILTIGKVDFRDPDCWECVARELGTGRTAAECSQYYDMWTERAEKAPPEKKKKKNDGDGAPKKDFEKAKGPQKARMQLQHLAERRPQKGLHDPFKDVRQRPKPVDLPQPSHDPQPMEEDPLVDATQADDSERAGPSVRPPPDPEGRHLRLSRSGKKGRQEGGRVKESSAGGSSPAHSPSPPCRPRPRRSSINSFGSFEVRLSVGRQDYRRKSIAPAKRGRGGRGRGGGGGRGRGGRAAPAAAGGVVKMEGDDHDEHGGHDGEVGVDEMDYVEQELPRADPMGQAAYAFQFYDKFSKAGRGGRGRGGKRGGGRGGGAAGRKPRVDYQKLFQKNDKQEAKRKLKAYERDADGLEDDGDDDDDFEDDEEGEDDLSF
ncbi:unnamed protein product [Vitrella brassicaformis CCMP3155]|uniref:Myb-like domain-containing protein n=3 Tax=Vitrella brassicaformis TaxID=1169539 RepID=A0A0G4F111_VITBC|nr:unnamed protein product [Vitrella brassicaformis CCMP3155]|eukprot:CEM05209.1 unnamed protein product [Vitrella brassicaformis CCMP3155]